MGKHGTSVRTVAQDAMGIPRELPSFATILLAHGVNPDDVTGADVQLPADVAESFKSRRAAGCPGRAELLAN